MRRAAVASAALVAFLASGSVASAALTARVDVFPSQPRVGQTATIQLRPLWPLIDGTRPPALLPDDFPWRVAAISPSGRQQRIRVVRTPDNPYLWSGVVRFRSRGLWTICVLNFSFTGRMCMPRSPGWQRLQVRRTNVPVDAWQRLERPFHIPSVAAGSRCPTTAPDSKGDLSRIPGFAGTAWGEGPAYPGGLDTGEGKPVLRYDNPIPRSSGFFGSAWFGNKVLWIVDSIYKGPVLLRGLQLDGPNELRFEDGKLPPRALKIPPATSRRARPSFTRVRAPGCYAYQVDGLGFSSVIIFEARPFTTSGLR
jgi:hypothetical protein